MLDCVLLDYRNKRSARGCDADRQRVARRRGQAAERTEEHAAQDLERAFGGAGSVEGAAAGAWSESRTRITERRPYSTYGRQGK